MCSLLGLYWGNKRPGGRHCHVVTLVTACIWGLSFNHLPSANRATKTNIGSKNHWGGIGECYDKDQRINSIFDLIRSFLTFDSNFSFTLTVFRAISYKLPILAERTNNQVYHYTLGAVTVIYICVNKVYIRV